MNTISHALHSITGFVNDLREINEYAAMTARFQGIVDDLPVSGPVDDETIHEMNRVRSQLVQMYQQAGGKLPDPNLLLDGVAIHTGAMPPLPTR